MPMMGGLGYKAKGWQTLVELPTHEEALALESRLRELGLPARRRWRTVSVGALGEQDAGELADRLPVEAPSGSTATACRKVVGLNWP
jgi:hypothetical protein